jgi:hypothetical protein
MLFREIITVYADIIRNSNKKLGLIFVKADDTYTYHCFLKTWKDIFSLSSFISSITASKYVTFAV